MDNFNVNNDWKFFNINEKNIDQERLRNILDKKIVLQKI